MPSRGFRRTKHTSQPVDLRRCEAAGLDFEDLLPKASGYLTESGSGSSLLKATRQSQQNAFIELRERYDDREQGAGQGRRGRALWIVHVQPLMWWGRPLATRYVVRVQLYAGCRPKAT